MNKAEIIKYYNKKEQKTEINIVTEKGLEIYDEDWNLLRSIPLKYLEVLSGCTKKGERIKIKHNNIIPVPPGMYEDYKKFNDN